MFQTKYGNIMCNSLGEVEFYMHHSKFVQNPISGLEGEGFF
jgi:hypothetical protein